MNEVSDVFSFLGSGYPLYFHYIKYCILILSILFLTSGQFNLLSNYFGNTCSESIEEVEKGFRNGEPFICFKDFIS